MTEDKEYLPNSDSKEATEIVGECYTELSKYVTKTRAYASAVDGLKAVYRRVIYASQDYHDLVKSASIVGDSLKYHPHGDASVYDSLVSMTCEFGIFPLFKSKGNFGGLGFSAAAMRYTEACLSDVARLMYLELIDYAEYIDGEAGKKEPKYLPALIPYCLLVGSSGIPVGMPTPNIPPFNALELVNYYIDLLEGRETHYPTPDLGEIILNCSRDETIEPLVRTGHGKLWFRGLITQEDANKFVVTTETPKCSFEKLVRGLSNWIDQDILDYIDETDGNGSRHVFTITNMSKLSPTQLKERMEKLLKCSASYNFILENDERAVYCGFDYIVQKNLKYLRECTTRKYQSYSDKSNKQLLVLQAIEAYKKSGKIKDIASMSSDEVKSVIIGLGFDEDTASEAIKKPISYLTKSHQDEINSLNEDMKLYQRYLDNPDEYLLTLYHRLRDLILPMYNKRGHSIVLAELENVKPRYAKLDRENNKIIISEDDSGESWNRNLYLVCDDGTIASKYVSSRVDAEVDLSSDGKDYKFMASDKGKYLIVHVGRYIVVKRFEDLTGSKIRFKIWDDSVVTGVSVIHGDNAKVTDERGNIEEIYLPDWEKSRISYPSRVTKYYIKEIVDA